MHRGLLVTSHVTGARGTNTAEDCQSQEHEEKSTPIRRVWNHEDGFGTRSEMFSLSLNPEGWICGPPPVPAPGYWLIKLQEDPFTANAAEFPSAGDDCCLGPLSANCSRFPATEKLRLHQLSEPFRAVFLAAGETRERVLTRVPRSSVRSCCGNDAKTKGEHLRSDLEMRRP